MNAPTTTKKLKRAERRKVAEATFNAVVEAMAERRPHSPVWC